MPKTPPNKLIIIGGVAGGASCATRARRLSETTEIIILERGPHVSFANCGLPYFVGNIIKNDQDLILATPETFKTRYNIDVRTMNEAIAIDKEKKIVTVKNHLDGTTYEERYDALVLSPGASPIKPPLPGIDLPGIFTLRTVPDSQTVKKWIQQTQAKQAVVIGGGYIGMEMVENFLHLGIKVTVIERNTNILGTFDPEMVTPIENNLRQNGVALETSESVTGFEKADTTLHVKTESGKSFPADIVILAIGVRPESTLACESGLEIGQRGGIRINDKMQTSDPNIWAVGDAIEVKDWITGEWAVIPLAGPANRQGRIAADNICGQEATFRGTQGTSVCGILNLTAAGTGASEKTLRRTGITYEKIYAHRGNHVGYYPGAKTISLKLLFSPTDGKILGAQAVSEAGAEKRIDVIAMLIQKNGTIHDLAEAELCYAPQYGAAKDPLNIAGMIAENHLSNLTPTVHWEDIDKESFLLDVRNQLSYEKKHVPNAINIPLEDLRTRLHELPKNQPIYVYCNVGQTSHNATRLLRNQGLQAKNISGGITTWLAKN
ncbi:MAG: FAD-dependent oxidoreductase [bacterium]